MRHWSSFISVQTFVSDGGQMWHNIIDNAGNCLGSFASYAEAEYIAKARAYEIKRKEDLLTEVVENYFTT